MGASKDFSLLTKLTLEMAGFDKGVDQAKQKTKDLAKGTEAATSSIKSSFSGLTSIFPSVAGSLSGIGSAVSGGAGAFKMMIPAITGVKTALISSGIGAIVVALGLAFAALASYMGGSSEGANKLKVVFAYLSGLVTAILNRIKLLGSAIWKLITGDFKGAHEDIKNAFKGGLLDEMKQTAEANIELAKKEIDLAKQKRELGYEEADNMAKIAELREKSKDFETYTSKQRLSFLNEAFALERQSGDEKINIAKQEYDLLVSKNKLKNMTSKEDKQAELDAYTNYRNLEAAKFEALRSFYREKKKLIGEVSALEKQEAENRLAEMAAQIAVMDKIRNDASKGMLTDNGLSKPVDSKKYDDVFARNDKRDALISKNEEDNSPEKRIEKYNNAASQLIGMNLKMSDSFNTVAKESGGVTAGLMVMAGAMLDAANKGSKSFKDLAKAGANAARDLIEQSLAIAVANAIKSISLPFPLDLIAIPVAVASTKVLFNSLVPQFAEGGLVSGPTVGLMGEYAGAKSNPEVIAPLSKLKDMLGSRGGEVTFRIEGAALVGVLNNHNRILNRTK